MLFDVAYQSYLPSLVERDQLVDGNGKLETSRTLAQTAGPALGGGLIGLVTAPLAIALDAMSFVASAAFVFLIRREEPTPDRHVDEHGQPRAGLRTGGRGRAPLRARQPVPARHRRRRRATSNLFSNVAFATFIVYAVRDLGLSPARDRRRSSGWATSARSSAP